MRMHSLNNLKPNSPLSMRPAKAEGIDRTAQPAVYVGVVGLPLLPGQAALLDGVLDSRGLDRLDLDRDGIQRLFHGEEQVAHHVDGGDSGLDLEEKDMITVDNDLSALIDPTQLYQGHSKPHSAKGRALYKSVPKASKTRS